MMMMLLFLLLLLLLSVVVVLVLDLVLVLVLVLVVLVVVVVGLVLVLIVVVGRHSHEKARNVPRHGSLFPFAGLDRAFGLGSCLALLLSCCGCGKKTVFLWLFVVETPME